MMPSPLQMAVKIASLTKNISISTSVAVLPLHDMRTYAGEVATADILTDGTDKFVGGTYSGVTDATGKTFISGASNDVITMNGSTKGGLAGSIVKCTAIASAKYAVEGIILGSGTLVTPFADA